MPSRLETREELNSDLIPIEFDFQSYFIQIISNNVCIFLYIYIHCIYIYIVYIYTHW